MEKDVIYIDVEDDITAIVSKIKTSKRSFVALVPPKRIGVLQSAVNLRLLARAAKQANKKLAIITNNSSLGALAASAAIPIARNLQSEPELAEVAALSVDDGEDVIDGGDLPVSEHIRQTQDPTETKKEERSATMAAALAEAPKNGEAPKKPRVKNGAKVPSFNKFRKKMIIIAILALGLIGFLVWAIFFAPRATVVISAKTTSSSVNLPITIATSASTDIEAGTLKAISVEEVEEKTQTFPATGEKDAGTKATGTVNFSNSSSNSRTIAAGTKLTNNGLTFVVDNAVEVPAATLSFSCQPNNLCPGTETGSVTAAENGSKYNAADGRLSGTPSGVSASFEDATSGGVSKMVKIVTAADVQKAKEELVDADTDAIKTSLREKFKEGVKVVEESFAIDYGDVNSTPAIGEEAEQGTLKTKITYKMVGVSDSELDSFLKKYNQTQLDGTKDQRVYDDGTNDAIFQEAKAAENGATATLIATAKVGPNIEDTEVKNLAKGKRYGEIQEALESIKGVDAVDVKFFPFWVSSVPNDDTKITVDFNLEQ